MNARLTAALIAALFVGVSRVGGAQTAAPSASAAPAAIVAPAPAAARTPSGTLALNARALRAKRTAAGFTLGGQALVSDPCHAARFELARRTVFPAQFDVIQYRARTMMGAMCMQHATWVTIPPFASGMRLQTLVNVITKKGVHPVSIPR